MNNTDISMPVAKAVSAVTVAAAAKADVAGTVADQVAMAAAVGGDYVLMFWVTSIPWGTIAGISAALLNLLFISEWFWKKLWRPLFERRGWIKRRTRYVLTEAEWKDYEKQEEKDQAL